MSIASNLTSGPYVGNGSQTAFAFTFTVAAAAELRVQVDGLDISSSLYTVAINADGTGTVTFSVAPVNGASVLLISDPNWAQETILESEGEYTLDTINAINRRDGVRSNWLARVLARFLPSGWETPANLAGKYVAFDGSGNPVASVGTGNDSALRTDLAASGGAALTGKAGGGTVQDHIDLFGSNALGTVAAGTVRPINTTTSFTGDAGGTTTLYANQHTVVQQGANNTASVRVQYNGTEITGSGTCTLAVATHNYVWAKDSAAITFGRVIEAHMVSSSSANITDFIAFNAVSLTHTGSGTIASSIGYSCSDISDATKVTNATGFYCSNLTGATSSTTAFRTDMASGTGKTAFYSSGTAQNIFAGFTAIGFNGTPLYPLHVSGSVAGGFASQITNTHATNPFGLRVSYSAAAPNTTDNEFIRFEDSGTTRFAVMSNGSIRINGTQVVGTRKTGWTAATGSATRTTFDTTTVTTQQLAERLKALIDDLTSHGLIGS